MRLFRILALPMGAVAATVVSAQASVGFPVLGIGDRQAARLSVVNLAANEPKNPSTCAVDLLFLDRQGKQAKRTSFQISPGQAVSLELRRGDLPAEDRRLDFRALVIFGVNGGAAPPTVQPSDCGSLFPTLEVFNVPSGRTTLVVTATKELPLPKLVPP